MVISRVTQGSYMRKPGKWSMTGSSQPSLPSSTRIASAAAVKALVVEPIWNSVSASTGCAEPSARIP